MAMLSHSPSTSNSRHLDRSDGQFHRPSRSGETPVFAFVLAVVVARPCCCRCLFFCLSSRSEAEGSAVVVVCSDRVNGEDQKAKPSGRSSLPRQSPITPLKRRIWP